MNKSTASDGTTQDRPPRPRALAVQPEHIPDELKALKRWVTWRYTWLENRQKWDKPPLNARTGKPASSTNPRTWSTFEEALAAYKRGGVDGIGLVLRKDNHIVGIDLDHCRNPANGEIKAWALKIARELNVYTEVSPSATGLRAFAAGTLPGTGRHRGDIEM